MADLITKNLVEMPHLHCESYGSDFEFVIDTAQNSDTMA